MNIYESAEDYLERILMLQQNGKKVRSIDVAQSFGYSRASISRAINNLKSSGHILIDESGFITLNESGLKIAEKMLMRHTQLTDVFIKLGVPKEIAINDACKIEHDISEETFNALVKFLDSKGFK